jgi:hypothetical protein
MPTTKTHPINNKAIKIPVVVMIKLNMSYINCLEKLEQGD